MTNDMTDTHTHIERVVMRRVRLMRILLLVLSTATFAGLAVGVSLWGIGREVWVARVFENGPQDLFGRLEYLGYAFAHTRLIVQVLSLFALASFVFLVRELFRFLRPASRP